MSLLTLIQRVANEIGFGEPETVVGSTDTGVKQLLAITYRVGNDLREQDWPRLQREHTFTLVSGTANYAFPADFDRDIFETHWNRGDVWPLYGPMLPQEWQAQKSGLVSVVYSQLFRIKGYADAEFFVHPTPDSSDDGKTLVYEYQSLNWIRPATWTTGTVYAAGDYTFYNGYYFSTALGGTAGASAPTPSSLNDGGVLWAVSTAPYTTFLDDTDTFNLDEDLIGLGVQWNYLANKGLPFQHLKDKYNSDVRTAMAKGRSARTLSYAPGPQPFRQMYNVPETGFGS